MGEIGTWFDFGQESESSSLSIMAVLATIRIFKDGTVDVGCITYFFLVNDNERMPLMFVIFSFMVPVFWWGFRAQEIRNTASLLSATSGNIKKFSRN